MRYGRHITVLAVLAMLAASPGRADDGVETKTFVAYSMKVAQARVEAAARAGEDFRTKEPDLYYLGGITKPQAVILDADDGDWILVGERDPKSSVLTLDDWVVALRARFVHPEEDPGVTIDPRLCADCLAAGKKAGCDHCTKQDVRFFAGVENTHFGQVCYEADWLMKRIGLGLERVPVPGMKTYYSLALEQARSSGRAGASVSSRFWFYPIVNNVRVFPDVVLLESFRMGVFAEVLHAELNGKPITDLDHFADQASEGFSRSLSDNYDAIAQVREVFNTLRGLTRLTALAKGVNEMDDRPQIDFYLARYPAAASPTPKEADVLKAGSPEAGFAVSGGVELMALVTRLKAGDASAFRELALKARARAAADAVSWEFGVEMAGGQPTSAIVPDRLADPDQIAPLLRQAAFLDEQERYAAALECYDKIVQLDPDSAAMAWSLKGGTNFDWGKDDDALACFDKALAIDPSLATALDGKAMVLTATGHPQEGLDWYEKLLAAYPTSAHGMVGKAMALVDLDRQSEAVAMLDRAVEIEPSWSCAWDCRGVALAQLGKYEEALASLGKALAGQQDDSEWTAACLRRRAAVLGALGRYKEAVSECQRASELLRGREGAAEEAIAAEIVGFAATNGLVKEPQWLGFGGRLTVPTDVFPKLVSARWRDDPEALTLAGLRFMMGGETSERSIHEAALAMLDLAIERDGKYADAHSLRGVVLDWLGRYDEAAASHARALALCPGNAVYLERLANNKYLRGQSKEALATYEQAIKADPGSPTSWLNKGVIVAQDGKNREALKAFNKALEIYPRFENAICGKAMTLSSLGRKKEARQCADQAPEMFPESAKPWFAKGMVLWGDKDYHAALTCMEQALAIDPSYCDAWTNRVLIMATKGRTAEALSICDQALKENPKAPVLWNVKAQVLLLRGDETGAAACAKMAEELSKR